MNRSILWVVFFVLLSWFALAMAAPQAATLNCSSMRIIGSNAMVLRKQGYSEEAVWQFVKGEIKKNPDLTPYTKGVIQKITRAAFYLDGLTDEEYGDFVFDQCQRASHLQRSSYHPQL